MSNNIMKTTPYNGGLYGCLKDELLSVIEDLDSNEDLYIVSVKTLSNITVYSFPGTLTKIKNQMSDFIDAMNNEEIVKVGTTWINTKNVATARICKYLGDNNDDY